MKRLQRSELKLFLACPDCGGDMETGEQEVVCCSCSSMFGLFRDRPVLLSQINELFPASSYRVGSGIHAADIRVGQFQKLKRLIPKKSLNLAWEKMFHRLSTEHGGKNKVILVVGCGNRTEQFEHHFPEDDTMFVFCDIDKSADIDLFCDSHELVFKNNVFDGVMSTAVLEHVLYPEKVVKEMYRVLKDDGFIYSEIPFLQSVHEGAYDFTRFTMSGHRRLLEFFEEIDSGMVAGLGTALVWSICDFFKGLVPNQRASSLLVLLARFGFFWLKYFDHLMKNNPTALNAASCTYFYGSKVKAKLSGKAIIRRYQGSKLRHV